MGTKTADGADAGTEAKTGATALTATGSDETTQPEGAARSTATTEEAAAGTDPAKKAEDTASDPDGEPGDEAADEVDEVDEIDDGVEEDAGSGGPSEVGQGAAALVSAGLGLVSLTGGWIGTVAAARETLVGQLQTSSSASVAKQVKEIYGDAWHTTAFCAGAFALLALIVGVAVLARPAFGTPGKPQAAWIKSVAWAGVSLGVIGLLLAVLKYSDALLALPSTS